MSREVTIRMYNVGFGDSFLVTIPTTDGPRKILFDCGSIKQAADGGSSIDAVADDIIAAVRDADGKARIDVVVATHRHRDHVSGFANSAWKDVEVREVWMPWTENPSDPEARRIRDTQSRLAASLAQRLGADPSPEAVQLRDVAMNALSNEAAMTMLHRGFAGKREPRFLPEKDKDQKAIRLITTDVLPGVAVHVLGPSYDERVIRDMDPPAGQSYLRLMDGARDGSTQAPDPFCEEWWVNGDPYPPHLQLKPADRKTIAGFSSDAAGAVAVALDKAVNGTSLMLLFQIGAASFLFPGDAQWGTWQAAMQDPEHGPLLKQTTFYKVGHHGSHNATPVSFVQGFDHAFKAMVSTAHMAQWGNIPKSELLTALLEKHATLARTDKLADLPSGFTKQGKLYVETAIPV